MALVLLRPQIKFVNNKFSTRYSVTYELDGETYGFRFYTIVNTIEDNESGPDGWAFDIFNPNNLSTVVGGIGLAMGLDLLFPYRYLTGIPPGNLFLYDLKKLKFDVETQSFINIPGFDPGIDGFSDEEYSLLYQTAGS